MKRTATLFFTFTLMIIGATEGFGQRRLLENTTWRLVEAAGASVTRSSAALSFDAAAMAFSGNTGCNSMSGTVSIRGKNIAFGPVRTTRRACKLAEGNVAESVVLSGIKNTRTFDARGNSLRLYDRRGRIVLRFTRDDGREDGGDASRLDDRKWVLEQIKGRQTFVALPYAFLNLDAERMSAGGDTSCNPFGGRYTVRGDSIRFTNIMSTMRACIEDNKMSVERDLLDGLRAADRFEISGNRLLLYQGRALQLTFRGEKK